jgi:hypothetical protein
VFPAISVDEFRPGNISAAFFWIRGAAMVMESAPGIMPEIVVGSICPPVGVIACPAGTTRPMKRYGEPGEVAPLALHLASAASSFTTGGSSASTAARPGTSDGRGRARLSGVGSGGRRSGAFGAGSCLYYQPS